MIEAPWSEEQCAKLNEFQACGYVHPFTCRDDHPEGRALVATPAGWCCPRCDYRQSWAHESMLLGAPPHPFAALLAQAPSPATTPTGVLETSLIGEGSSGSESARTGPVARPETNPLQVEKETP